MTCLEHPSFLPDSTNYNSKISNKFDGRMKIKHLIQVHIQMKAIESDFGYLYYWTEETGYL